MHQRTRTCTDFQVEEEEEDDDELCSPLGEPLMDSQQDSCNTIPCQGVPAQDEGQHKGCQCSSHCHMPDTNLGPIAVHGASARICVWRCCAADTGAARVRDNSDLAPIFVFPVQDLCYKSPEEQTRNRFALVFFVL